MAMTVKPGSVPEINIQFERITVGGGTPENTSGVAGFIEPQDGALITQIIVCDLAEYEALAQPRPTDTLYIIRG